MSFPGGGADASHEEPEEADGRRVMTRSMSRFRERRPTRVGRGNSVGCHTVVELWGVGLARDLYGRGEGRGRKPESY